MCEIGVEISNPDCYGKTSAERPHYRQAAPSVREDDVACNSYSGRVKSFPSAQLFRVPTTRRRVPITAQVHRNIRAQYTSHHTSSG
jgi:hypothetical protein